MSTELYCKAGIGCNECSSRGTCNFYASFMYEKGIKDAFSNILRKRFPLKIRVSITDWKECEEYKDIKAVYDEMIR